MNCCFWVLLHAPNLGHGTDYLTSPPKEGMLRIFTSEKRLRPGLNLRTREPEASMLTTRPPKPSGVRGKDDVQEEEVWMVALFVVSVTHRLLRWNDVD
jgi:hypothetical protein